MFTTIAFESNSPGGYLTEVGIARWLPCAQSIQAWSTLIQPTKAWAVTPELSDPAGRRGHGSHRVDLVADGRHVADVARRLNALLGTGVAYSDNAAADADLADRLHGAAGIGASWKLRTIGEMARMSCDDILVARAVLKRVFHPQGGALPGAGPHAVRIASEFVVEQVGGFHVEPIAG